MGTQRQEQRQPTACLLDESNARQTIEALVPAKAGIEKGSRSRLRLVAAAALWPWIGACAKKEVAAVEPSQQRFEGVGVVLVADAVPGAEMEGVKFYDDRGYEIYGSAVLARRNRSIMALGGARVPVTVRVVWRDKPKAVWGSMGIEYEGTIVGDHTIEVAGRIPEEVLQSIRQHGGALRLKFRLKSDGVLFGWDIEMRPNPHRYSAKEIAARNIYLPPAYRHTGGDFKEARPAHYWWDGKGFRELPEQIPTPVSPQDQAMLERFGLMTVEGTILTNPPSPANHRRVWEKGWYIDKKTDQKVETDF